MNKIEHIDYNSLRVEYDETPLQLSGYEFERTINRLIDELNKANERIEALENKEKG